MQHSDLGDKLNSSNFTSINLIVPSIIPDRLTGLVGGYHQIGKIVVVNMFFQITAAFTNDYNTYFAALPTPLSRSALCVFAANDNLNNLKCKIETNGNLTLHGTTSAGNNVSVTGMYIAK